MPVACETASDIEESFVGATLHLERIERERDTKRKEGSIYTRTGDKGVSSLFNGDRVHKSNSVFDALGDVDELNACVGLAFEHCSDLGFSDLCTKLEWCMRQLLRVGSLVATPRERSSRMKLKRTIMDASCVKQLESWIDDMSATLPTLSSFVLPIGGKACATLHVCRATSRRAERAILRLDENDTGTVPRLFMNRLSDFFFMAARVASDLEGRGDVVYNRKRQGESSETLERGRPSGGGGRRRATLWLIALAFLLLALAVHTFENPEVFQDFGASLRSFLSEVRAGMSTPVGSKARAPSSTSTWGW